MFINQFVMLKRCLTGFLLVVFLYNAGGYYLCFRYYQESVRREMKLSIRKGIPANELTEIIIDLSKGRLSENEAKKGISWVKPGKEFRYKGNIYDVVKTSFKNNRKTIYCINDSKEKKLLTEFWKLKTRRLEKRIKSMVSYYSIPSIFEIIQYERSFDFGIVVNFYHSTTHEVLSPPPTVS